MLSLILLEISLIFVFLGPSLRASMAQKTCGDFDGSLLPELVRLSSRARNDGEACDLLFLPHDNNGSIISDLDLSSLPLIEKSGAVSLMPFLDQALIENNKCPLVVLPTSNKERVEGVSSVASKTRFPVSLAVVTHDENIKALFQQGIWRATFDTHLISKRDCKYQTVKSIYPVENKAWKQVRVAYAPRGASLIVRPNGIVKGLDWEVLKVLSQRKGLSYTFKRSKRAFVGIMDAVENGNADLAVSQGSFEYIRYQRTGDISAVFGVRLFRLLVRLPQQMAPDWTIIYPFDFAIWLFLAISILTIAASLALMNSAAIMIYPCNIGVFRVSTISVVALINEALPPDWFNFRLFNRYGAILLFTWLPSGLLISLAYKSTLLASLVSVEHDEAVDTWQELLDNKMTLALDVNKLQYNLVANSPRPILQKVLQECVHGRGGAFRGDRPAWLEKSIEEGTASRLASGLKGMRHKFKLGEELRDTYTGWHSVRKFPWKEEQDKIINHMWAGGIFLKIAEDTSFKADKTVRDYEREKEITTEKKLTPAHLKIMWFFLVVGLAVSTMAQVWERGKARWMVGMGKSDFYRTRKRLRHLLDILIRSKEPKNQCTALQNELKSYK